MKARLHDLKRLLQACSRARYVLRSLGMDRLANELDEAVGAMAKNSRP